MTGLSLVRDLAVVMLAAGAAGWLCRRAGLAAVVGYLAAGALIGPYTPLFQLVVDLDRIQALAQLGLVFLVFAIGLDMSFQRLRRLGLAPVLATLFGALIVLHGCRLLGFALGWSDIEGLFLAGMLMISSSAVIGKILEESGLTHQRAGQLALGVSVLEDIVAVLMLTLLATLVQIGAPGSWILVRTLGGLGSFIAVLLLVALFFVPRLLARLAGAGDGQVRALVVIGLLLGGSLLSAYAGYSPALGAFLLGVIVASTPHRPALERLFQGLREVFGAVFFVAMGMLVDLRLLAGTWPLVLGLAAFTLLWRSTAVAVGLTLVGNTVRDAVRAGLAVTPLGEFTFIIAHLGVASGALPPHLYPVAVAVALLTALAAPGVTRGSARVARRVESGLPRFLCNCIGFYHEWLARLGRRRERSVLWRLTGWRLAQIGAQVLVVSALVLVARPLHDVLSLWLGMEGGLHGGFDLVFWMAFGGVLLVPLVATWRSLDALALIYADAATQGSRRQVVLRPLVGTALKAVGASVLTAWLLVLLPFGLTLAWGSAAVLGVLALLAVLFRRRLVRWHSRLEVELKEQWESALGATSTAAVAHALQGQEGDWALRTEEFILPDFAVAAGRAIGELGLRRLHGCSVVSIDRQGFTITSPDAEVVLYPGDRLLLLGTEEQIGEARRQLGATDPSPAVERMEELSVETVRVPANSPAAGRTLMELDLQRRLGVQVAGIQRGERRILPPRAEDRIEPQDELLALGTALRVREFRKWLSP